MLRLNKMSFYLLFVVSFISCNERNEDLGSCVLFFNVEKEVEVVHLNNIASELIMGASEGLSDAKIDSAESCLQKAFEIDSLNELTNYNFYLLTGIIKNYERRLLFSNRLFRITQDPVYLIGGVHALKMLSKKEEFENFRKRTEEVLLKVLKNNPKELTCWLNIYMFYCIVEDFRGYNLLYSRYSNDLDLKFIETEINMLSCEDFNR